MLLNTLFVAVYRSFIACIASPVGWIVYSTHEGRQTSVPSVQDVRVGGIRKAVEPRGIEVTNEGDRPSRMGKQLFWECGNEVLVGTIA